MNLQDALYEGRTRGLLLERSCIFLFPLLPSPCFSPYYLSSLLTSCVLLFFFLLFFSPENWGRDFPSFDVCSLGP